MTQLPLRVLRARQETRRQTNRLLGRLRTATYINKWLTLGVLIGVVAGLGALVFYETLGAATHWLLGTVGGYHPAGTAGEGGPDRASHFAHAWAVPLVVGAGGLASGLLVFGLAPEAEGHGTDAAISAVHHNPTGMRPRVAVVKLVASALTIGSGGSGGREGPTAQISASFGSILARTLSLSPGDAAIAVSAGIASGIAAIFRAPLGGALLGVELLYRDDVETDALIPSVIASIVAFVIFGSVEGFNPIFGFQSIYTFNEVRDLVWFSLLGLLAGGIGWLYTRVFYGTASLFARLPVPRVARPALAGLVVGMIGLGIPGVLGTGYGSVQQGMDSTQLLGMSLWVVVALPFAKILATSLSIGSGGSGGIFGPGMVIGGATGAALWRLLEGTVPWVPASPVPFVIVGMTACFGAIAHAPISVMLMVAEMTGNLSLLAPAMVAIALATLVVRDTSIYQSQLKNRAESPLHRLTYGLPLAASVPIADVMAPPRLVLSARLAADEALGELYDHVVPGAPVVNANGAFIGNVQTAALADRIADGFEDAVGRAADPEVPTVSVDASLDAALQALATSRSDWVPVLNPQMHVVGIVGTADLVRGYRLALRTSIRRLGAAARGAALLELTVGESAAAVGPALATLRLPPHTVVVAVVRKGNVHFADGHTTLKPGDVVSVLTRSDHEDRLRTLFDAPTEPAPSDQPSLT